MTELQPFGTPEGSRADIAELSDDRFVAFDGNVAQFGALAIPASDLGARVFVGRKGAGKTVYLRRAQAFARDQQALYADIIQQELPTTTQIFSVNRWFSPSLLPQVWMAIWRVAILRSLFTFLAHEPQLANADTPDFVHRMRQDYGDHLPVQQDPMSVYSQVRAIVRRNHSGPKLLDFLEDEDWDAIELRLGTQLADTRPICFYLDAVDEEFRHAPMHWLMCQKGLFYQVMRFLRSARLGGRLHIVISIRDLVYSSIMQTEHMTRYVEPQRIRVLEWNIHSIRYLLRAKVEQLDPRLYLGDDAATEPLARWLGTKTIKNSKRNVVEDLEFYILRHTRLIPRDLVILLNMLHISALAAQEEGRSLRDEELRTVVSNAARLFGIEQLAIAGNQLSVGYLPREAVEGDFVDLLTGELPNGPNAEAGLTPGIAFDPNEHGYVYRGLDQYDGTNPELAAAAAYQRGIIDDLSDLLLAIGFDRFTTEEFSAAEEEAERLFAGGRALSVLWQNGLLGYTEDDDFETGAPVFYSATNVDSLDVPANKSGYVLHPCLIDAIGLSSRGAPVVPFRFSQQGRPSYETI